MHAAEQPRIQVNSYKIEAELFPSTHKLVARTTVNFTALDDLSVVSFDLNNALRPTKIVNEAGKALTAERITQTSSIRIPLPAGLTKGTSTTLTFDYEGVLSSADDSPVQGLKLAYVGDDISYLLYAGRWFPVSGYGLNRYASDIEVTVPAGYKVVGSGPAGPARTLTGGRTQYAFSWKAESFPGTIVAGKFDEGTFNQGGLTIRTYVLPDKKPFAQVYAETAAKEFSYFSSLYGPLRTPSLNIVELPNDTVPMAWAPEIAALSARAIDEKTNYRLLADAVAHQWWGAGVSPATANDFWLSDGFARYSEVRYVESAAGQGAYQEAVKDMSVGALAYDTIPLASSGQLDMFSPEFQSLVTDKGGMILHMLRWVVGDAAFQKSLQTFFTQFNGKPATTADFRKIVEQAYGDQLTSFFSQWFEGTGAPQFKNDYSVYRLGNNKGFRVVGEVDQDLDLFRMPVEVRVDTDGKPEMKRIEVVGSKSPYVLETFGRPRRITIDPNDWVLKTTPDLKVRVAILRGQQLVQQGDLTEALKQFNQALEANSSSSLAHYRIAEVFFLQHNYQSSANEYRESLNGDGEPRWTEVCSYIQLGKIFDATGQRERAVNSYRQALQTNDNTQGALDEARKYLSTPYKRSDAGY
jgi:hypothetical protein